VPVEPTFVPIYLNWEFWAVVLSVVAVTLSQIPPIHILLRPKKLDVEVHSRIYVCHMVGNPNTNIIVSIRNTGGRTLRVKKLRLSVTRDRVKITTLLGLNYFETPTATSPVLFVPFSVKPDEEWTHNVSFFKEFDRQTEKLFRDSSHALNANISAKTEAAQFAVATRASADPEYVKPFEEMFKKLFIWEPGEYILNLEVEAEPDIASYTKQYRFTLYESDTKELAEHAQDYVYGPNVNRVGLWVPLSEHVG
jgi:hypothetical protein